MTWPWAIVVVALLLFALVALMAVISHRESQARIEADTERYLIDQQAATARLQSEQKPGPMFSTRGQVQQVTGRLDRPRIVSKRHIDVPPDDVPEIGLEETT